METQTARIGKPVEDTAQANPGLKPPVRDFGEGPATPPPLAAHQFSKVPVVRPQFKLTVNDPGDQYEDEADQVADQVMSDPGPASDSSPAVQRQAPPDDDELQMKADSSFVQRAAEEDLKDSDVSGVVEQGLSGGGQPLDAETRAFMEDRFGHDFSQVRVHSDSAASESAHGVAAKAYTVGPDIAFKQGHYQPGSESGRELLAHELTHVVQQGGAARKEETEE
jgi:hypothetical protein